MTKIKAAPISADRLKSLAQRIENLMDERDGIQSDIRDIYAEAKSAGYVPKVLRKAITRKRMDADKRDEEDTILDLYEDALSPTMRKAVSMAKAGATARQIEAETGIDQATVARSVSLNKKSETEKTADLRNTPAGDGIEALTPDGQGAVAGNLSDAAGRYPGDEGEENDAPKHVRVSEADRQADAEHGASEGGGEGLQRRAGQGSPGWPGQDVPDPRPPNECDVGQRGDHAVAGRNASDIEREATALTHSVGALASASERVARPDPYEDAPPAWLDRRA